MQSGFDINELLQAAQTRWLKPAEVLFILQNHANYQITQETPQKPPSGSLFLYNKRVLRFFRKDGYSWRKKKDGRTVGEAHERLKVGNAEALNCYYAHGEVNPNFQRRSYWMLDPAYEHIVLVHYREITEGKLGSGSIAELSPGTSSKFSQSPSAYTLQNPGSSCLSDMQSYQNHSSPGSIEVSSDAPRGKGIDCSNGPNATGHPITSPEFKVSQALRRLEMQLSLDDDSVKDYAPASDQNVNEDIYGVLDEQYDSGYGEVLSNSNGASQLLNSGSNEVHCHVTPGMEQSIDNGGSLMWNDVFELSKDSVDQKAEGERAYIFNANGKEVSSARPVEAENHHLQDFGAHIDGKWTEAGKDIDFLAYSSHTYSATPELSTMLLDPIHGMTFGTDLSLTAAKDQKFTIREISPEWGFSNDSTRVFIIGSFLCDSSESEWLCMFGDVEVPLQIIQDGVFCCQAPARSSGKVPVYITSGNRESCSEIREFEYRDKHNSSVHFDENEEPTRSTEEMLLLVRLVQMLLSNSPFQQGDSNECGVDKLNSDDDIWNQIIEGLLVGGATSFGTLDWLLQQLLKDKLQQWLSTRSMEEGQSEDCFLSRKEQGIIHMIAGLGYEWALNPVLGCGVGINFRDINGWTALHWAARFGREKMVAALIASGASAVALTDPSAHDPTGRNAAYIAAKYGHKGLAGYLSELALTSHLSSLTLEESELSKGSADIEAELAVKNISKENVNSTEDQLSLKHTLAAVRNSAQAAARIQAAFRAHSFRKRLQREAMTDLDEYGFTMNDIHGISAASKFAFHNVHDHQKAALSIQKSYRGWKGRKDFQTFRQKVVKIQAHVRGYQVRKKYKAICWAVGILDRVVLRWRRKGAGLRGFKPEADCIKEAEDEDDIDDIIKVFRKEKVNVAIDEAVTTVLSMVESPEARQQYHRMLGRFQEAKAELEGQTSPEASGSHEGASNMVNDDFLILP